MHTEVSENGQASAEQRVKARADILEPAFIREAERKLHARYAGTRRYNPNSQGLYMGGECVGRGETYAKALINAMEVMRGEHEVPPAPQQSPAQEQGSSLYEAAKAVVDYWENGVYEPGIEARLTAAVREHPVQEQGAVTPLDHVAWLRFRRSSTSERPAWLQLCNSSDDGAFPVYRESSFATLRAERDEAQSKLDGAGDVLGRICVLGTLEHGEKPVLDEITKHASVRAIIHQIERAETAEASRDAYKDALEKGRDLVVRLISMVTHGRPTEADAKDFIDLANAVLSRDFTASSPAIADSSRDDAGAGMEASRG